jgi:hypothetical protein
VCDMLGQPMPEIDLDNIRTAPITARRTTTPPPTPTSGKG